jgi:hypothetical protein
VSRLAVVLKPIRGVVRTLALLPDVVEAILVLPKLSRQLEEVRDSTATLPAILAELERVHADTQVLLAIRAELTGLYEVALPLQGAAARFGRFADRIPQRRRVTVEVDPG